MTTEPVSSPASKLANFALRLLRAVLLLVLCGTIAVLFLLAAFAAIDPIRATDSAAVKRAAPIAVAIGALLPVLLLWLAYRLRLRSWWWLGGGWLLVAPVLVYLATDEPAVRRPLTMEEVSPPFPGAAESYAVLHRYEKNSPATKALKLSTLNLPRDPAAMPEFAAANRARIETIWADHAPLLAWYDELNAFDRIGDLGEASLDAPIPAFAPHRAVAQVARLKSALLTLDGRGDEAIATVLPVLEVTRKLQVHSRSLVRSMIAQASRNTALDAAEFALARTAVSPEMRARLHTAIGPAFGEAGVRRLFAIEYAYWASGSITSFYIGTGKLPAIFRVPLEFSTPVFINPNRTINLMGDHMAELQDLAARRLPLVGRHETALKGHDLPFKNLAGAVLLATGHMSYQRVVDSYWKLDDRCAALRARLEASATAAR